MVTKVLHVHTASVIHKVKSNSGRGEGEGDKMYFHMTSITLLLRHSTSTPCGTKSMASVIAENNSSLGYTFQCVLHSRGLLTFCGVFMRGR